jgi:uncharacterized membrane protein
LKLTDHPLHPALAHFPVAFWTAAVAADAAALVTGDGAWWTWSHHALVAGLLTAAVALLAGAGEAFFRRIPREARRTLAFHITSMVAAFALFLASLALRKQVAPSMLALVLSALGLATLVLGGWFGGSLVYRFGVGTQHAPPDSPG